MQKIFCVGLVVVSFLFGQEPSAFNAGGSAPRKTETQILEEKLFNLSTQLKNLEESQEGLKSIFESQIQKTQDVVSKIELLKGENNATITEVKAHVDSNFALQNENIEKIKNSISALGALIKKNNAQTQEELLRLKNQIVALENAKKDSKKSQDATKQDVTNQNNDEKNPKNTENNATLQKQTSDAEVDSLIEELNSSENTDSNVSQGVSSVNDKESVKAPEKTQEESTKAQAKEEKPQKSPATQTQKVDLKKKPLAEIFKEGEEFYNHSNFSQADEYLRYAVKENYKPARGNYLLGEIAFQEKRYEDAIYYYKTSATRYDKANYMPRLMLNSAKSFTALKERENAQRFLETLITLYPQSSEAKEAKKLISQK